MLIFELAVLELHGRFLTVLDEGDFGHFKAFWISRSLILDSLVMGD
jgi:hypothetical protein